MHGHVRMLYVIMLNIELRNKWDPQIVLDLMVRRKRRDTKSYMHRNAVQ
jgi:hypothetical protein